jgi:hypothetical protein
MATVTVTETAPSVIKHREPLRDSGSLESFESIDITPAIGTEFTSAKVDEWLNASNSDDLIRDLAIKSKLTFPETLYSWL